MNNWQQHIPNVHQIFWIIIVIIAIVNISKLITFLTECLSEQNVDGTKGKGSSKRLILFLFATGFIYAWIYSIHENAHLDPYVSTLIVVFLLLGLAIIKPDQANTLIDKLKGLTTFKSEEPEPNKKNISVTTNSTTEVKQVT